MVKDRYMICYMKNAYFTWQLNKNKKGDFHLKKLNTYHNYFSTPYILEKYFKKCIPYFWRSLYDAEVKETTLSFKYFGNLRSNYFTW